MSKLLEKAHCGEEPVIPKAGTPFARLLPLETQAERIGGRYKDEIAEAFFDPLPEAELDAWES